MVGRRGNSCAYSKPHTRIEGQSILKKNGTRTVVEHIDRTIGATFNMPMRVSVTDSGAIGFAAHIIMSTGLHMRDFWKPGPLHADSNTMSDIKKLSGDSDDAAKVKWLCGSFMSGPH